jgi:hypothetical protein
MIKPLMQHISRAFSDNLARTTHDIILFRISKDNALFAVVCAIFAALCVFVASVLQLLLHSYCVVLLILRRCDGGCRRGHFPKYVLDKFSDSLNIFKTYLSLVVLSQACPCINITSFPSESVIVNIKHCMYIT